MNFPHGPCECRQGCQCAGVPGPAAYAVQRSTERGGKCLRICTRCTLPDDQHQALLVTVDDPMSLFMDYDALGAFRIAADMAVGAFRIAADMAANTAGQQGDELMANHKPMHDKAPRVYVLRCSLPNPGDRHLSVVLHCTEDGQWVTWLHNDEKHGGDTAGHYFGRGDNGEIQARQDFAARVIEFMQNYLENSYEVNPDMPSDY